MFHIPAHKWVGPNGPAQSSYDKLVDIPAVNELADKLLEGSDLEIVPESAYECEYGQDEYQWRLQRAGF